MAHKIAVIAGDGIGKGEVQELAVGIIAELHQRMSRQRRPSRCISISASSGPDEPAS